MPLNGARTPVGPWDTPSTAPAQTGEAALLLCWIPRCRPRSHDVTAHLRRVVGRRGAEPAKAAAVANSRRQWMVAEQQGTGAAKARRQRPGASYGSYLLQGSDRLGIRRRSRDRRRVFGGSFGVSGLDNRGYPGDAEVGEGGAPVQWDVVLPAITGVVATLLGVVLGGVLTRRQQSEAWSRDRQVEACASIVRESTRVQLQLEQIQAGKKVVVHWAPWNESLAVPHLVGHPATVAAGQAMDEAFWVSGDAIKQREAEGYMGWNALRDPLEATRLEFINTARRHLMASDQALSRLVARVPSAKVKHAPAQEAAELPSVSEEAAA